MKKHILNVILLLLFSSVAHAHNGDAVLHGFDVGFLHPITGWDHLLMMVAVGLMAAQTEKHMRWLLPTTFIVMMIVGCMLSLMAGLLSGLELFIALTVVTMGYSLILVDSISNRLKLLLVGFFALPHGWAHGMEVGAEGMATLLGLLIATILLHVLGASLHQMQPLTKLSINRLAGSLMLVLGSLLAIS